MQNTEVTELQRLVIEAARHVLPACGLAVGEPQEGHVEQANTQQIVAFMGFTGDMLRGTMAIVAPVELLRAAYPLPLNDQTRWQLEVFDWTGEIANRLLGRIKLGLTARGADIEASTPRVMQGEHLHLTRSTKGTVCSASFPVGNATLRVWFDAIWPEDRALFPVSATAAASSPPEGDVLLFD
jgi:CheY-specific phosphatase CheX